MAGSILMRITINGQYEIRIQRERSVQRTGISRDAAKEKTGLPLELNNYISALTTRMRKAQGADALNRLLTIFKDDKACSKG